MSSEEETGSSIWKRKTIKIEEGQIIGRWSIADSAKLRELYEANTPIDEICRILHRDEKSVRNKVIHTVCLHRSVKTAT